MKALKAMAGRRLIRYLNDVAHADGGWLSRRGRASSIGNRRGALRVAWKKRERGNEQGTVAPRRNKTGKITSYVVAIRTGLGRGELLGPKWVDLDLDAGTLSVRHGRTKNACRPGTPARPRPRVSQRRR